MQSLADFLFRAELKGEIRVLLIGARALEAHGYVRNTKDLDFLIATSDVPVMDRLLGAAGYHKEAATDIFSRWRHRSLQAEDVDVMFVSALTFEALSEDAIIMKMGTAELRVPSASSIVALKLHAMKNNPDRFGKDAPDVLELMKRQPTNLNPAAVKQLCSRFGTPELWSKLEHLFP